MNSGLVPTPRVDKNGRTVVRHMKPSEKPRKSLTAPPVAPPAVQKMSNEELVAKSMEIIHANLSGMLSGELDPNDKREHLELVYELCVYAQEHDAPSIMMYLADRSYFSRTRTKALSAHREYFRSLCSSSKDAVEEIEFGVRLFVSLTNNCGIAPDPKTGQLKTLTAHVKADRHYEEQRAKNPPDSGYLYDYTQDNQYVQVVERNAHVIDELLKYREIFPPSISNGPEDQYQFDQAHFDEYLKHGAIRDGYL